MDFALSANLYSVAFPLFGCLKVKISSADLIKIDDLSFGGKEDWTTTNLVAADSSSFFCASL